MTAAGLYEDAMRRALTLAGRGPITGGNPQVGCVLLTADGSIVAEGWHRGAGTPHAEVDALSKAGAAANGLTAVVTLEPCNHTGRTGPCAEALLNAGIARVVYAVSDPDQHAGGGVDRLHRAGVEVIAGVLAEEATEALRPWLTATRLGRPFVTVKWAATLDGRVAAADGSSRWITGTASRQHVHEQRARHDAILVGTGTVLADDPELTARGDGGELLANQPLPVVLGERAIPADARVRSHPAGLMQLAEHNLDAVLATLFDRDIRRVLVEGGPTVASAFIAAGLVDEYLVYLGPSLLGEGALAVDRICVSTIADARPLTFTSVERLGDDVLIIARPREGT